ncbi:unnamed protein product [Linum trigynum]|uniref:Uncharacterized protein n=1 Tax=Linum trigynum TaxID=586398 RepID=A0AAV2DWV7_9ROSI
MVQYKITNIIDVYYKLKVQFKLQNKNNIIELLAGYIPSWSGSEVGTMRHSGGRRLAGSQRDGTEAG